MFIRNIKNFERAKAIPRQIKYGSTGMLTSIRMKSTQNGVVEEQKFQKSSFRTVTEGIIKQFC